MKESCQHCKIWEQHFYWKHFDLSSFHFLKVMEPDFSDYMVIPNRFVNNFKGKLSGNVDLKGPSGNIWHIKLNKFENNLVFKDGWKEFAEDHHIKEGDSLVFKCVGNLCFSVLIFGSSGCERAAAYFSKSRKNSQEEHIVDDSAEFLYESFPTKASGSRHAPGIGKFTPFKGDVTSENPFSARLRPKRKFEDVQCKSEAKQGTDSEKGTSAWELASRLKLSNPSFVVSMRSSHLSPRFFMTIPFDFVAEHLKYKPEFILLKIPNGQKSWPVHCRNNGNKAWGLSGQYWKKFVLDNNLEEGDSCVFELSGRWGNKVFDVHIFQDAEEGCSDKVESKSRSRK